MTIDEAALLGWEFPVTEHAFTAKDAMLYALGVGLGADPTDERELQLATIASWCAAHGLAEMADFGDFRALKEEMGGDAAFLRAVLRHFGTFAPRIKH